MGSDLSRPPPPPLPSPTDDRPYGHVVYDSACPIPTKYLKNYQPPPPLFGGPGKPPRYQTFPREQSTWIPSTPDCRTHAKPTATTTPPGMRSKSVVPSPTSLSTAPQSKKTDNNAPAKDPPQKQPEDEEKAQKPPPSSATNEEPPPKPSSSGTPPIGLSEEYFDRVKRESEAFAEMKRVQGQLEDDFSQIASDLKKGLSTTAGSPDQQDAQLRKSIDTITNRLDMYERKMEEYKGLVVRGPWDVSDKVDKSLATIYGVLKSANEDISSHKAAWSKFVGNRDPDLNNAKGMLPTWLRKVEEEVGVAAKNLEIVFNERQDAIHEQFERENDILTKLEADLEALQGRQGVSKQEVDALIQTMQGWDMRTDEYREKFVKIIQDKIDVGLDLKPTEAQMKSLGDELKEVHGKMKETDDYLMQMKLHLEDLKSRPVFNKPLLDETFKVACELKERPNLEPHIQKITERLDDMENRFVDRDKVHDSLNVIREKVVQLNDVTMPVKSLQSTCQNMENAINTLANKDPPEEYTKMLDGMDQILKKFNEREDDENSKLGNIANQLDEIAKHPQADHTETLGNIIKSLDDLKARPSLEADLATLKDDVNNIKGTVAKYDSKPLQEQVEILAKTINEKPGLNVDREELVGHLKSVQGLIKERPPVNQQDILDKLMDVQKQTDTMDFPTVMTDLDSISNDVKAIVNRPTLSGSDMRQMIQGVHDNLDEIKQNPVLTSNRPLLTQDYYDQKMNTLGVKLDKVDDTQERSKTILDVVQNVHQGVQDANRRPVYDARPLTGISKQIDDFQQNYQDDLEALKAKIDRIGVDDGDLEEKFAAMKQELKGVMVKSQRGQQKLGEAVGGLKKFVLAATILSAIPSLGILGYKIYEKFFKKDKNGASNAKKRTRKQRHPRDWNVES